MFFCLQPLDLVPMLDLFASKIKRCWQREQSRCWISGSESDATRWYPCVSSALIDKTVNKSEAPRLRGGDSGSACLIHDLVLPELELFLLFNWMDLIITLPLRGLDRLPRRRWTCFQFRMRDFDSRLFEIWSITAHNWERAGFEVTCRLSLSKQRSPCRSLVILLGAGCDSVLRRICSH